MLGYYIKSTIVFLIIYFAAKKIGDTIIHNRADINYKDYIKEDSRGMWYTFCFIPIVRVVALLIIFWSLTASKESLDKLFEHKEDQK